MIFYSLNKLIFTNLLLFVIINMFYMDNKKAYQIFTNIRKLFSTLKCELNFNNNFELLVAVILSAQCTDKRVNIVTSKLFKVCKTPKDFCSISIEQLEELIKPCGFYKNKARNLKLASEKIVKEYNGQVPSEFQELIKLNGVGRKTANVISSVAFNKNAIAVDTHVFRVSNRLKLSESKNVLDCENDLQELFEEHNWSELHHSLVLFGRYYCKARNPQCADCVVREYCNYYKENK